MNSPDSSTPPSICGRFRAGAITPIKFQLSNAMRSMTSKTGLITNETRGLLSSKSTSLRPSSDTFDTWDTSSVEAVNNQTVGEITTPLLHAKSHLLEMIPGSSIASKTPSPHDEIPSDPPRIWARSRSYSPMPPRRKQLSPRPSVNELHIHPLFRSDSPMPPPIATPGTAVVASPNAGQVIPHHQSLQLLNQTRAVSNPMVPSPLSHSESMDSRRLRDEQANKHP